MVVVTGASTGIGAATARELARRGFHVLAGVRRDQDADAIRGVRIEPVILDITDAGHIEALAARVDADPQGRAVRALVNNAAVQANVPIEAFAIDQWRRMFEVNLFGQVAVTQAVLPALIRSKGRVVNISSVGGKVAMAAYGPYGNEIRSRSGQRLPAPRTRAHRSPRGRGGAGSGTHADAGPRDRHGRHAGDRDDARAAPPVRRTPTRRQCPGRGIHQVGPARRGRGHGHRHRGDRAHAAHPLHRGPRGRDDPACPLPR